MSELSGYAERTDDGQVRCTVCGNEAGSLALLQHDCIYANDLVADGGRVEDDEKGPQTKYGELIEDHEWEDPEPEPGDESHPIEVGHHMLVINDERDSIERYNGLQWSFIIDDGTITAVDQSHYCPGPGHVDPMGFVAWDDVPAAVRRAALRELNGTAEEIVDVEATEEVVR